MPPENVLLPPELPPNLFPDAKSAYLLEYVTRCLERIESHLERLANAAERVAKPTLAELIEESMKPKA